MDNRVYLCIQNKSNIDFNCKLFRDFLEADLYFENKYNNHFINATMININYFIPIKLDKYILDYKIKNMFCKVNII